MSTRQNDVVITLLYTDDETRSYKLEDVADNDLASVKSKIKAINANENDAYANFYKTFVSNDGASVAKIESCRIISTQEEEIYSG